LAVDAGYTFSKLIDSASPSTGATKSRTLPNTQIPWQYYRIERALSDFDRPHVLTLAWVAELPWGKGRRFLNTNTVLSRLLGGYQLNGIFTAMSGPTNTIVQTRRNTVLNVQRPNVVDPARLDARLANGGFAKNAEEGNLPAWQWLIPCWFEPSAMR